MGIKSLIQAMDDDAVVEGYKPTEEYDEELRDPLVDLSLLDSTELWLIQWPYKQVCYFFLVFFLSMT